MSEPILTITGVCIGIVVAVIFVVVIFAISKMDDYCERSRPRTDYDAIAEALKAFPVPERTSRRCPCAESSPYVTGTDFASY